MAIEIAKTNLYAAEGPVGILIAKTNLYVVENTEPAFPTPNIDANQARGMVVARFRTPEIDANFLKGLSLINYPTEFIKANQVVVESVFRASNSMHVNAAEALVVCRGRVAQPRIKVWTFTLDGHDFYVLQLQEETLIYDFSTQQWHVWGSFESASWRAIHGIDWKASIGSLLASLGGAEISNVLVGDDTTGALYFLAPQQAEDDYTTEDRAGRTYPFVRHVHAQITHRGRDYMPLNGVLLTGSVGDVNTASNLNVTLTYSDDRGHTYNDAGSVLIEDGNYDTRVEWRSLGALKQPGRLLKITDYGGLVRIDGLDIPDADQS